MSLFTLEERQKRLEKANKALSIACHIVWHHKSIEHENCQYGSWGPHFWSIPADKNRDLDIAIADALNDLKEMLTNEGANVPTELAE